MRIFTSTHLDDGTVIDIVQDSKGLCHIRYTKPDSLPVTSQTVRTIEEAKPIFNAYTEDSDNHVDCDSCGFREHIDTMQYDHESYRYECEACMDNPPHCSTCAGSGEGMYDGSSCRSCGGSGSTR